MMKNKWQLQEAKNRLSYVIDEALRHGPQTITRRGVDTVMVIAVKDYRSKLKREQSFIDFILASPLPGSDLVIDRDKDTGRDIEL